VENKDLEEQLEMDHLDEEDTYYVRILFGIGREDTSFEHSIGLGETILVQPDLGYLSYHYSDSHKTKKNQIVVKPYPKDIKMVSTANTKSKRASTCI